MIVKVHTNTLLPADLINAAPDPTVEVIVVAQQGSRSHARAYDVTLRGVGARHSRRPNSGHQGAAPGKAATYDDWGWWLARLYDIDPSVKAGGYHGREDFHAQTEGKFRTTL